MLIILAISLYSHDLQYLGKDMYTYVVYSSAHYTCHNVCVYCNNSTLPLTSLLPAASEVLKTYEDKFLEVVHAKQSLLKLEYKGVISADVKTSIESANEEDAKYLLLKYLKKNATVGTLREYCKVAIAADAFPRMQELGRKMINTLPPEKG